MITFPPYGRFATHYERLVHQNKLAPSAFRPTLPPATRHKIYVQWFEETVGMITTTLWPRWDRTTRDWASGNGAKMLALTLADFALYKQIRSSRIFFKQPVTPVCAAHVPSHQQYFIDEDTKKVGARYCFYDTTLPTLQLGKLAKDIDKGIDAKAGSVSIQVKGLIQRPRPYQVALLLGRPYRYERAYTSMTASMSSGHSFEGCILAVAIYQAWVDRGFKPNRQQVFALGQFGVDIGDRRVFAGVHYPSDNLAAWIVALRLVNEVCPFRRFFHFLANAITTQSHVFQLIRKSKRAEYKDALALIDKLVSARSS